MKAVADFIREEKIDCDFVITRAMDIHFSENQHKGMKERYEKLVGAGVESTRNTFCPPEEFAEQVCFTFSAAINLPV